MAALTFDSLVARRFEARINSVLDDVRENLGNGSAMLETADRTAMKYCQELGYVRGLTDTLVFLREVEDEVQGRVPEKSGVPLSDRE